MEELRKRWDKVFKKLVQDKENESLMEELIYIESSMVRRTLWSQGKKRPTKKEILAAHEEIKKSLPI